ncbi:MAG: porin [Alphaproteobacteria bacterium]|nr:porin [Alphaproteobacteria bacterium]
MKKLLLSTAALGLVLAAAPAMAEIDLDIGGNTSMYGVIADDDQVVVATPGTQNQAQSNQFDFVRNTELYFSGESALDNGLTVGAHFELSVDGGDDAETVDESYAYFSGGWGRVNLGDEDGAAYLLQVAAPSADSVVDGLRQDIQPFNYDALINDDLANLTNGAGTTTNAIASSTFDTAGSAFVETRGGLDYDQDLAGKNTKLTYLTPVFSGFQGGVSFTPDGGAANNLEGVGNSNDNAFGATYEGALRYEGQFDQVGVIVGGGLTFQELERELYTTTAYTDATDDRQAWNIGLDLDIGAFGIGTAYLVDDNGNLARLTGPTAPTTGDSKAVEDEQTWVVGADYTTGAWKVGASYMTVDNTFAIHGLDTDRWTGGVVYTYGPGMTFNGSVQYVDHELKGSTLGGTGDAEVDAAALLLGTQINF